MRRLGLPLLFVLPLALGCESGGILLDGGGGPLGDDDDDDSVPEGPFGEFVLNEVSSSGDDLIELLNRSSTEQDLGGFALVDGDLSHDRHVFPAGTLVPAGGFVAVTKEQHELGLGDLDGVHLFDPAGELVDRTDWVEGEAGLSWCRFPDGTGSWGICARPTPGLPNVWESPDVVVEPLAVGGLDDWASPEVVVAEPNELGFDRQGRLWAGDQENLRVQVFALDGAFVGSVGGQGTGPGQFAWAEQANRGPESIKVGPDGLMYVVDRIGRRVNRYDPDGLGALASVVEPGRLTDPTGLAITSDGRMLVADQAANRVVEFELDGTFVDTFQEQRPGGGSVLNRVETLAVDEAHDRLFASSENERTVQVFRLSTGEWLGQQVTEWSGGAVEPGRITVTLEGIAVDAAHDWLFVCDEEAGRFMLHDLGSEGLVQASEDFAFLGSFGSIGSGPGRFLSPDGVAISPEHDRLAVADQGNDRVQIFRLSDIARALSLPLR